ncbi:hypothetical protein B0H13DRAFT_2107815 [Mycena leptocephala]|nr:hypothetical protein B0H13DRAFT_2107815 [Mycena leptocephala]
MYEEGRRVGHLGARLLLVLVLLQQAVRKTRVGLAMRGERTRTRMRNQIQRKKKEKRRESWRTREKPGTPPKAATGTPGRSGP